MDENLAADGHSVRRSFNRVLALLEQIAYELGNQLERDDVESEMQRFFVWAINLGLFHQHDSSLDYRLRFKEIVRISTKTLLSTLTEALNESQ